MTVRLIAVFFLSTPALLRAQAPATPGNATIHAVGKDGLRIDGKLTKDDPPLANAPIAQLNGAPHQVFQVKLQKGQSYVIELVSKDFDAYLILQNALGTLRAHDDDSGGTLNSRIVFTAPADGDYRVVAAALDRKPGVFELKVRGGDLAAEQKLAALATKLNDEGVRLYQQGNVVAAVERMRQALKIRQDLFPASRYPDGHADLAMSLNNLGGVLKAMGQAEQAFDYLRQSLAMRQKLFPVSQYPDGHADLAVSFTNLGGVLKAMGHAEQALGYYRQSLSMRQKLFPVSQYPDGHADLAISLNNLGGVLKAMGQADQALGFYRQSLAMKQKLLPASQYPNGHPDVAISLNNLGAVLQSIGQLEPALDYYGQGLEMYRKLFPAAKYPDGHPELAQSLNNVGGVLKTLGQAERALRFYRESLEMREKLFPASHYPHGHADLAQSTNNVGSALNAMGHAEPALGYYRASLAMKQQLFSASKYPNGHPDLAGSLNNLGFVLQEMGQPELAHEYVRQSLEMHQRLLRRELATASEEAAFDRVNAQSLVRDAYLTLTRTLKKDSGQALALIWPSRSMVTRLLEQRQANARAAGTAAGAKLDALRGWRRRIEQLLLDTRRKVEERDKLLTEYADKIDKLQRELVAEIPVLNRWQELDQLGPADLVTALPPEAVFIDVICYTRFDYVEKKEKRTPCYVAFVVGARKNGNAEAAEKGIHRIELEDAATIDAVVRRWRSDIDKRVNGPAGMELADRVWAKLAPHLPTGTKTIYIAADSDLARVPWAALPVGNVGQDSAPVRKPGQERSPIPRVLLEDYAIAQVPHGLFLIDHLLHPRKYAGPESLLALGGVEYTPSTPPLDKGGQGGWPALPGTLVEARAVQALAAQKPGFLTGKDATADRLTKLLPTVRYAHLATHGEFKADELTKEKNRAEKALESRLLGDDTRRIAAKNPLGYVGLILSEGKILSGLTLVDLPLENLKLATLSACETGLGEYTAGEGVQGLQRAFHVAGCANVVASLWRVNDAATAALMTKFYHGMWVNKKPPIEALREAQLTIYRHPELIPDLAGERGPVRLRNAIAAKASVDASARRVIADTKLWAAFVLSGLGR